MCRLIRYTFSHSLYAAMNKLEELRNGVSLALSIHWLGYLSTLNLIVAISLGLYASWEKTAEPILLVVFILGLFVLGMASIFYYYFGMKRFSLGVFHLWLGFLLGLLCFLHNPSFGADLRELVSVYLLIASAVIRTLWALVDRICGCSRHQLALLTSAEALELTGFAIASMTQVVNAFMSLVVLALAVATLIVDLRMKSFLAVPNLICFSCVTSLVFFPSLGVLTNPYALVCFLSRHVCEPLLDIYFSGLSVTERWLPFLRRRGLWRRLTLLPLLVLEVAFLVLAAFKMGKLDQWYFVIPGFLASCVFWIICHVVLLVTLWGFHNKLSDCQRVFGGQRVEAGALDRVMASKGMRHFCLVSKRLVLFSLFSTVILGALSWQESHSLFIGMFLLVLPLESLAYGLFYELGSCLGGTCVGYAVIIPTNYCSVDGPMLLPPDQVQELNQRCTGMLNSVQRFFTHHIIDTFGCDYSSSGFTRDTLNSKLHAFLEAHTHDGPRYDTYVLFYSGHTHRTGEWALIGGDALRLDEIVQLWREKNGGYYSRLVVVLDTENSVPWVKDVRNVKDVYIAVQGATLSTSTDLELQNSPQVGDFITQWVEFNCDPDCSFSWSESRRTVAAAYGISRNWADYKLHLPTGHDVAKHWRLYFPSWTYPVVQLAHWSVSLNLFWTCGVCLRFLRRLKLRWFPPAVLDTGQGFKLVRS